MAEARGTVIWTRPIDHEAIARNKQRFLRWYVLPSIALALLALVLGGPGQMLGVLILLGLFGLLLFVGVWAVGVTKRQNPEIRLDGQTLVLGNKRIDLTDLESWTVFQSTGFNAVSDSPSGGLSSVVLFRFPDYHEGERGVRMDGGAAFRTESIGWANMPESDLMGVRESIAPHMPAPYVEHERFRD